MRESFPCELVEVRRHRDNDFVNRSEEGGAVFAKLGKKKRRNFRGCPSFAIYLDDIAGIIHELLDMPNGAVRIASVFCGGANQFDSFELIEENHGRRQSFAVTIGNNFGITIISHVGQGRCNAAEVNPDTACYFCLPWKFQEKVQKI